VALNIYDMRGRLVRQLVRPDAPLPAGRHRYIWDAIDDNGRPVPSGHYIYYFAGKGYKKARKMTLLK
jgi:flagellar hook assembly protein FlgD